MAFNTLLRSHSGLGFRSFNQTLACSIRFYHSSVYPRPPNYTAGQHKILSSALSLVPSTGFTTQTLLDGAKKAGYLEITHNLFPRGVWSLVEFHLVTQREALSSIPLEKGVGAEKAIRKLCIERLKANEEIIGQWQEVLAALSGSNTRRLP